MCGGRQVLNGYTIHPQLTVEISDTIVTLVSLSIDTLERTLIWFVNVSTFRCFLDPHFTVKYHCINSSVACFPDQHKYKERNDVCNARNSCVIKWKSRPRHTSHIALHKVTNLTRSVLSRFFSHVRYQIKISDTLEPKSVFSSSAFKYLGHFARRQR